jgi:hypothetical protein
MVYLVKKHYMYTISPVGGHASPNYSFWEKYYDVREEGGSGP